MTALELAERDLRKIELSLSQARRRYSIPRAELAHIEELCKLRKEIVEIIRRADNEQRAD